MKPLIHKSPATQPWYVCLIPFSRSRTKRGFTLTEVVLALGIVAFAFLPVLGLLPVGLDTSRQAIDATVESQIVQGLSSKAIQADFSNLGTFTNSFYFDYQGNSTTETNAIYKVGFDISSSTKLPSSSTTLGTSSRLATVTICILNTRTRSYTQEPDPVKNAAAKKYLLLISDNGR